MKKEQNLQIVAPPIIERIQREYQDLLESTSFSLEKLFEPQNFRFSEFCKEFNPHPQSDELKKVAQSFGERNGIWLANAKHHITCALFLYPAAGFDRMLTMMKNLTLGFYLNDVMGRDTFRFLDPKKQEEASNMIEGMSNLNDTLYVPSGAHPLEFVNSEILKEFRDNSPEEWFSQFLQIYCYHIGITHSDGNTDAVGQVPGITDYMERRCHLGGVHHILKWIEYSDGQFLDWELLRAIGVEKSLKRIHWVTAAFAGLSNDLFSFEKEVIDHGSDSNLVMIIALNHPDLPLKEAIFQAAEIVRNLLAELIALFESIKQETEKLSKKYPAYASKLDAHVMGVVRCLQAIWMWHCHSKRYKRPNSLWIETKLVGEAIGSTR